MKSDGTHRRSGAQSRQAAGRRPLAFREVDALFELAENQIALLRRCQPLNGPAASAARADAHRRGQHVFDTPPAEAPDFGLLRRALEALATDLEEAGPIGALYAARAVELELEAHLAEQIGRAEFFALARRRHAEGPSPEWAEARKIASAWARLEVVAEAVPLHLSDDRASPESLVSVIERELGRQRLPWRVEVVRDLTSRAACGDGVIFIRAGQPLSAREAQRVAAHEIAGHALPRHAARAHSLGLLRVGSAGANDDEEGRALHIEAEEGLQDDARRRELGLRHTVAVAVADGAAASDCVTTLGQFGCGIEESLSIHARVARGGGLCREIEYLPAWLRFTAAHKTEPDLAAWLASGRLSLAAARVLRSEGMTAGAASGPFSTCQ